MKRLTVAAALLASPSLSAALVILNNTVNLSVPDDRSTGLVSQVNVADVGTINSVTVDLRLSAAAGSQAYLGDLYAYLQHGTQISVLLNRPGRRVGESFGYDDNQSLNVTFADAGANIHSYRSTLSGNDTTPLVGPLTGNWQPDGRTADPAAVLTSQSPTAMLSLFNGLPSEGAWRLFVADLSGGAIHQLDSWGLTLDITPVPEPSTWAAFAGVGLLSFVLARRLGASR